MPPSIPKASYSGDPKIHLPSMLWHYVGMPFLIPETCFPNLKIQFSRKKLRPPRVHSQKNGFSQSSSPDSKAVFPQQVKKYMKSTFHKCFVNVTPVTNPTPMSKSDEHTVKAIKTKIYPKIGFYPEFRIGRIGPERNAHKNCSLGAHKRGPCAKEAW